MARKESQGCLDAVPSEAALFQMVDLEALVPGDHLVRKLVSVLDLSFVDEAVAECYSRSMAAKAWTRSWRQ